MNHYRHSANRPLKGVLALLCVNAALVLFTCHLWALGLVLLCAAVGVWVLG